MYIVGTAVLDEHYDIKSANNSFFNFIGGMKYTSVIMLIKEEQQESFQQMFEDLERRSIADGIFDMLNYNGGYYPVYIKVRYRNEERTLYDLRLWDIIKSEEIFREMDYREYRYRNILAANGNVTFEYFPETDSFRLFMFNSENETIIYNDTLKKYKEDVIPLIDKSEVAQFERFCDGLVSGLDIGVSETEYCFKGSIFSGGSENQDIHCYCRRVKDDMFMDCVVGVIKVFSDKSLKDENVVFSEVSRDFLTGVLNKKSVKDYCEKKISSKPPYKMSMAIIDVDNFKAVNDTFGHLYGDKVLVKVAKIINDYAGEYGAVGRIGGDEFFVFFENVKDFNELRSILRSIRSSVEYEFKGKLKDVAVTLSIGVSKYPEDGESYDELFRIADKALYIAKDKGKNRYIIYNKEIHSELDNESTDRVSRNVASNRSVNNYKDFLVEAIDTVSLGKKTDYSSFLKKIIETFPVDRARFYTGDDLTLSFSSDEDDKIGEKASFFAENKFLERFDKNGQYVVNYVEDLSFGFEEVYDYYIDGGVFSANHCLIGNIDNINGMLVIERLTESTNASRGWSKEEIKDFVIIARAMSGFWT